VPLALGTQTGGSLIRPASFNGAFALKPTWGVVSREGAKLYSLTLDTVGWYGRGVADLRLLADLFEIPSDPSEPVPPVAGLRIALCESPAWSQAEAATREALAEAARRLAAAGATIVPLELPADFALLPTEHHKAILHGEGRAAFLSLVRQHGAAVHDDFQGRASNRENITPVRLRAAWDTAARCRAAFDEIAAGFHAVLTPSAPGTAPPGRHPGNPVFNQMWTLLHVPCVNLPGLTAAGGLPVGVTLAGPRFADRALLDVADRIAPALGA
jgi:Asp-tRNA(Asn)/Glu-tRNA(Gln) amidotransferase A subunit family amidase